MSSQREHARAALMAIVRANPEAAQSTQITEVPGGFEVYDHARGERSTWTYEQLSPARLSRGVAQLASQPERYGEVGAVARRTVGRALVSIAGLDGVSIQIEQGAHEERQQRLLSGATMTLYHQTTVEFGKSILATGFRRGEPGLAGSGIYFAEAASDTAHKAHNHGFMVVARVQLGRTLHLQSGSGESSMSGEKLLLQGYDSLTIPRRGREWVIYFPDQVVHTSGFRCTRDGTALEEVERQRQLQLQQQQQLQLQLQQQQQQQQQRQQQTRGRCTRGGDHNFTNGDADWGCCSAPGCSEILCSVCTKCNHCRKCAA
jgi:hypothetical protein